MARCSSPWTILVPFTGLSVRERVGVWVCWSPDLDTCFRCGLSSAKNRENFPSCRCWEIPSAAQALLASFAARPPLLAHVQPGVHPDPQLLLSQTAFSPSLCWAYPTLGAKVCTFVYYHYWISGHSPWAVFPSSSSLAEGWPELPAHPRLWPVMNHGWSWWECTLPQQPGHLINSLSSIGTSIDPWGVEIELVCVLSQGKSMELFSSGCSPPWQLLVHRHSSFETSGASRM